MVDRLSTQVETISNQPAAPAVPGANGGAPSNPPPGVEGAAGNEGEVLGGSAGEEGPAAPAPTPRFNMPAPNLNLPLKTRFGPGFEMMTEDEEYQFQFHDLTQVDYRGYWDTPRDVLRDPYNSTFGIPRQWWIFSGRLTKPFEYYVVPAFGFDNVNLLDTFLNIHYDDRLQIKIGRYKTPFTYEFYALPINGLVNPERSLFFNNFGLNRDVGIMAWGKLFDNKFDYAAGIFNGDRNFFADRNSSKDFAGFVNFRPFHDWEGSILENFNVGGSVLFGNQFQTPVPSTLRNNVATTGASFFGVPFLSFNKDVIESGDRAFWDLHTALYYQQLTLIAEWQSGFQDYAHLASPGLRTKQSVESFYVQAGYFLTGETVEARGIVRPLHNFDLRRGKFGLGAIELAGRYSTLNLGKEVFAAGLADPNLWSKYTYIVDAGVNWYWTQYIKMYMGWQHTVFGDPVFLDPGRAQLTNDMLWARFQIYF